ELLTSARRQHEPSFGDVARLRHDDSEAGLAVGGRELTALTQPRAADLDRIAGGLQPFDARVRGHDARDLGANVVRVLEAEHLRVVGTDATRDIGEDLPFSARLTDARALHLRAERDAPFRGRRRAA